MSTPSAKTSLKLVDPETASQPIKDALALLPLINVFRAMANAETLYPYFGKYMLQLFRPMETRQSAGTNDCPSRCETLRLPLCLAPERSCRTQRRSILISRSPLLRRGTSRANFALAKPSGSPFPLTDEVMDLIEATDATYAAEKKNFSDRAITEMLYVIGTYMLVVRVLRTGRVPLDDKPADSPQ